MHGFEENLMHGERETDRDEGEFIGPNPPGGRRTKNKPLVSLNFCGFQSILTWNFAVSFQYMQNVRL